jgi:hypothetical protein
VSSLGGSSRQLQRLQAVTDAALAPLRLDELLAELLRRIRAILEVDAAAVLLPAPDSPILTRELLYTAVTRARTSITLCGTEETIRAALARPAAHASGLGRRLWS